MLKLILVFSVLLFFQFSASGQFDESFDISGKDSSLEEEKKRTLNINDSILDSGHEFDYHKNAGIDKPGDPARMFDRSEYYFPDSVRYKYIASINIEQLLRPGRKINYRNRGLGLIFVGVKKPYYNLSGYPHINGKVDIGMAGSLFGIENTGIITFVYVLKSVKPYNELSSAIAVDRISYKIIIPFGKE